LRERSQKAVTRREGLLPRRKATMPKRTRTAERSRERALAQRCPHAGLARAERALRRI
jgi:hypothetical protein